MSSGFLLQPKCHRQRLFVLPFAARVADVVLKSEVARELASLDQPAIRNSARIFIHAQVISIYNASRQKNCVEVFGFHLADWGVHFNLIALSSWFIP